MTETPMSLRLRAVAEARLWLGTPFRHRGRLRGEGVDCLGLLVGVARALGLAVADRLDYPRQPDPLALEAALRAHLVPLPPVEAAPGDVLRLAVRGRATHLALRSERGLIHAFAPARAVVEHGWDGRWPGPAVDAWRLPEGG